jgi:hypothetical protein
MNKGVVGTALGCIDKSQFVVLEPWKLNSIGGAKSEETCAGNCHSVCQAVTEKAPQFLTHTEFNRREHSVVLTITQFRCEKRIA